MKLAAKPWQLHNKILNSRLIIGTSGYPSLQTLQQALEASGTEMVTVAIRRLDPQVNQWHGFLSTLIEAGYDLLPNTAGCYTAQEAIYTAQLAREALNTNWIKLEVIGDSYSLYPDMEELLRAARELIKLDYVVLPYCNDDPVVCQKLADLGCAAVMPLGAPIGSGQGIRNPYNLELIRSTVSCPVIIDAGVGTASHVSQALELGVDAVLLNTAIAKAKEPVQMAHAMKLAAQAGRHAFEAGRIPVKQFATPSSPSHGRVEWRDRRSQ